MKRAAFVLEVAACVAAVCGADVETNCAPGVFEDLQARIDAVAAAGGGRVNVTPGVHRVRPLRLRSGIELHLEKDAVLSSPTNLEAFAEWADVKSIAWPDALPRRRNASFVFADACHDVSITGEGTIDCNGDAFVKPKTGSAWRGWHFERKVPPEKSLPRVVFFAGCSNVIVRGITIAHPPAGWSTWFHACDNLLVEDVKVRADVRYPNNDGIHVNSCRNVVVRNCDIETGDDSIVVRANNRSLAENRVCENVVVSNCTLRSWSAGVRLGWTNDGLIRNCLFRDLRMRDMSVGIAYSLPHVFGMDYGREATSLDNVVFEDITMDGVYGRPILIYYGPREKGTLIGPIRNLVFRNVTSRGLEKPIFKARPENPIEGVRFENCRFEVVGDDVLPGYERHGAADWDRFRDQKSDVACFAAHGAVNWDDALVVGHTNGDKCFYAAGEEMVFTLELKGVKGEIPPGEYFLDWVRTANDGKTEKGRAEASLAKPLVIRTSLDRPGFVKIEANLVDKTGKRVPKKHQWEKRVFFQGGAGVDIEKLQAWPEPKDFDAHWAAERKIVDDLPLKVIERAEIPCANPGLRLWRMKLNAPEGYLPATGYLVIPKAASAANRMKATGKLSGYYDAPERCPSWLTNHVDGIEMYINRHGCEVDRESDYYKQFYRKWPMPPDHFRGMVFRALQMFRFLKTLPEWNGKDLIAYGTSGGGMQTIWMGALVPGLSRVDCTTPALADVYGFKYGRASSGLGAHVDEINYYDICNFAKRVTCPVTIGAGLGDYTCPPAGIAIVYNNLKGRKQITWSQGCTHGWWPSGMKKVTFEAAAQVADNAELARRVAEDVAKPVRPAGENGQPFWNGASWMFMYPPSFEFKKVPGAAKYRFTAIDDIHRAHTMEAAEPTALLTPMWGKIPARGLVTVICDGLDAKGNVCGRAGMRRFWKSAPFTPGGYKPAPRSYAEAAAKACDFIWSLPNTRHLLEKGEPDPSYSLNCYPAKMSGSVIGIMLDYAKRRPARAKEALAVARAAADYLLRISQPADAPLAHFPPTYRGTANTAKQYAGQQMLLYPARAAENYLKLADATGDKKYAAAAENIGRTYLKLQGADGTWYLKLWEKDGKPVLPNRVFPLEPLELFEKLYARTKDPAWRAAADRAFAYIEKGPLTTWNWECQFEDVQPHPPYKALTKHQACSTAMFLLARFPGDTRRLAQARELLRFAEDQFVYWEKPCRADGTGYRAGTPWPGNICDWNWDYLHWATPGVGEQYGWEMPIDASNSKLIRTYLALYKAEGNPLDLAKARALGDTLVNVQKDDGSIRTQMLMRPDADNFWINCMGASIRALDLLAEATDHTAK